MLTTHWLDDKAWRSATGPASQEAPPEGRALWVEAVAPDPAEQAALAARFGLHPLALRDALTPEHPPTFREFDEYVFTIIHAPESAQRRATRKLALFVGCDWLVTIVRQPLPLLEPLVERLHLHPGYYLGAPVRIAHALLDHMAQSFEEQVDALIDETERLQEEALERSGPDSLPRLHELRRRTAHFTRIVRTQRDVCQALGRGGHPCLTREVEPEFRSVADHMLRIYDLLEAVRDGILAARDNHLATVNHHLSMAMRTLTAVSTILLPLSLVAGIFGMNFETIPLVGKPAGFWIVVGSMAVAAVLLYVWFRLRRWL